MTTTTKRYCGQDFKYIVASITLHHCMLVLPVFVVLTAWKPTEGFCRGLQRFKEMRESQGGRSRDERQKREQAREEKALAKVAQQ